MVFEVAVGLGKDGVCVGGDINVDGRVGLEELILIMQRISKHRK